MESTCGTQQLCLSCGAALDGRFCAACGEPAVHEGDLKLSHLNHDFLHEFIHVDGKIWRTIRALLFEPGRLTAEYWAGRRGPWIRPLRVYLIVTALQILLASNASGPMGLRVWADERNPHDIHYSVGQKLPEGAQGSLVNEEVNHRIQTVYLWIRYLSLGLVAAASLLLYRKSQPYFGGHLIFALHFYSFESIIAGLFVRIAPTANPLIMITVGFVYLWIALRRIYHANFLITSLKALGLYLAVSLSEVLVVVAAVLLVAKLWPAHA